MHYIKLLASTVALITFSLSLQAETKKSAHEKAQRYVAEYKALRRICTVAKTKEKQECFGELSARTEAYKTAKILLEEARPASEKVFVGYAD